MFMCECRPIPHSNKNKYCADTLTFPCLCLSLSHTQANSIHSALSHSVSHMYTNTDTHTHTETHTPARRLIDAQTCRREYILSHTHTHTRSHIHTSFLLINC